MNPTMAIRFAWSLRVALAAVLACQCLVPAALPFGDGPDVGTGNPTGQPRLDRVRAGRDMGRSQPEQTHGKQSNSFRDSHLMVQFSGRWLLNRRKIPTKISLSVTVLIRLPHRRAGWQDAQESGCKSIAMIAYKPLVGGCDPRSVAG